MGRTSIEDYATICRHPVAPSRFSSMTGGCPCRPFERDNLAVVITNEMARTVTLQWYGSNDVMVLEPGFNRIIVPRHQQMERAKVAYEICTPRCKLYWCPWTMLEIGRRYRIREECNTLQIAELV